MNDPPGKLLGGIMTEHDDEYDDPEPDHPAFLAINAFLEALSTGNESAAAKALRRLVLLGGALEREVLETLAERFEGQHDPFYPWQLQFRRPGRKGAPPADRLRAGARQFAIARLVNEALAKPNMNKKAAVAQVSKQLKLSKATVNNAYYAERKKGPSYK